MALMSNEYFQLPAGPIHGVPLGAKVRIKLRPNDFVRVYVQKDGHTSEHVLEVIDGRVCLGQTLRQNRRFTS